MPLRLNFLSPGSTSCLQGYCGEEASASPVFMEATAFTTAHREDPVANPSKACLSVANVSEACLSVANAN